MPIESGAYDVMDKGYVDFKRLYKIELESATWITRAKDNMKYKRQYSSGSDRSIGIICDHIIVLTGYNALKGYPIKMRRIRYKDSETGIT